MTVATTTNKAIGTGNGVTTVFPFTFGTLPTGDLVVTLIAADGTETVQVENTDYTVLGEGADDGGAVVFSVAPANGVTVLVQRILPYTQPTDYKNNGSFYPRTHERSFDRATMQIQQLSEETGRTIKIPPQVTGVSTTMPMPAGATFWGWNESGTAPKLYTLGDIATTAAFQSWRFETFTGDGNETEFNLAADPGNIANLDVSIDGVTQVPGTDYGLLGTEVSFSSAPPVGAVILIRYGQAVPEQLSAAMQWVETPFSGGQSVIVFPGAAAYGQIVALSLNGVMQHPSAYSANGSTVSLTEALAEAGSAAALVSAIPANNISAGNIGVTADVPGAPTRTLQEKSRDVVSLRDAGAVGDGVTDDATAIAAALGTGRIIDGGGLTYKVNSPIELTGTTRLRDAVIDLSGLADSATAIAVTGALGAPTGITATVSRGATSFTLSGALALAANDMLILTSSDTFTQEGTPVALAEWVRVKSVAGSVVTIYGEVQFTYSASPIAYKPTMPGLVELENVHFIGGGVGHAHKAITATRCDRVRFTNCTASDVATWSFGTIDCRDVKASSIDGFNGDDATNLSYLVAMSGVCESAQAVNISGHNFRHVVTSGGTSGVVRVLQVVNVCGTGITEATADAHPAVHTAMFRNIKHEGITDPSGNSDAVVSQALHTYIEGVEIAKSDRMGVLVQPQCHIYAPSVRVSNVRAAECGDYGVNIDMQYARVKLSAIVLENIGIRGGTRGFNIATGASSLGCAFLRVAGASVETSTDRCGLITATTSIDHIEFIGGKYNRGNQAAEVIHINNTAGMTPYITAQGIETIGGTTGLRAVNAPSNAIVTGNRFSGWATNATTGFTAGATILNSNNLTA